jgi:hypothetical protein
MEKGTRDIQLTRLAHDTSEYRYSAKWLGTDVKISRRRGLQDSACEAVRSKQYIHFSSFDKSARMHCSQGSRSRTYT